MIKQKGLPNPMSIKTYNPNWEPWLTLEEVESMTKRTIQNGSRKDGKYAERK